MQQLIIRLGANAADPIHWLVYSKQEQEIIASGVLQNADELSSLQERASSAKIIALAPSSELYFAQVALPENASRKVLSAIPFMIEEELCGDINNLFFALGERHGDTQEVAVIDKQKLNNWQQAFADANLFCDTLIPDAYCLPREGLPQEAQTKAQTTTLLQLGSELLVKSSNGNIMQGEASWLLPLVSQGHMQNKSDSELSFNCYSEIDNWPSDIEATYHFDLLPMQLLLEGAEAAKLNLYQGDFVVKHKSNAAWDKWKLVATLAAVALSINLVFKATELNSLKSERSQLTQQIDASIKQNFPSLASVRLNKRKAIQNEVRRLEQGGGNASMLVMLSKLGTAFESSGVKPRSIRFDSKRAELRMQSVAANFEALEKFSRDVGNLGFEIEQGAFNNQGDQVVGTITVKG
ncbi:type II secretion system protein GspL [Glaciecola petra]|uniref:Type II secretion system protein L n=1 Tax=Glaciecola petra TaxID=3075602 RepID=A0ABU2ZRD3_9ALTE|nr:type II secretion system protein GspL [Aestuariibacter sp. P117]MDT0595198.1 type II secretion system protein GspL [Aestuariibacter sp. P117]